MLRRLYTLLFYVALPVIFIRLWFKAYKKNPAYFERWQERLGLVNSSTAVDGIWLHAVSVGESIAAVSLIKQLKQHYPELSITVTNETPTGATRIKAALGDEVTQCYVPYDVPFAIKRFLQRLKPRLLILMETELWPNMLHICRQKNIPILLANARLSERSAKRYQRIKTISQTMLNNVTMITAQTEADAQRFVQLGYPAERITVTGSIKFDLTIPSNLAESVCKLRQQLGENRLIWIAASTHEGEEEQILSAFAKVQQHLPEILLLLVPRHPERFNAVAEICKRKGYDIIRRSENKSCDKNTSVFIGDSMGELLLFYAVSHLAFIGGSLVEKGGQNPLEAAALAVPLLTGPHTFNFALISEELQKRGAEIQIVNSAELADKVIELLPNKNLLKSMGQQGREFVEQNRGAVDKQVEMIKKILV